MYILMSLEHLIYDKKIWGPIDPSVQCKVIENKCAVRGLIHERIIEEELDYVLTSYFNIKFQ